MKGGLGEMPLTLWVLVAAVVLYLYLRRAVADPPTVTVGKPTVTVGKGLGDLLRFAQGAALRATQNDSGQYILTPQPGWRVDIPGLAADARRQGFNASSQGQQIYVSVPYAGAQ